MNHLTEFLQYMYMQGRREEGKEGVGERQRYDHLMCFLINVLPCSHVVWKGRQQWMPLLVD